MQEILLNVESKEVRMAYLKNGLVHDLLIERKKTRQLAGNIYRGRVTNILDNIQSAFIDIDEGENGFIHISDILENTQKFQERFSMDFEIDFEPQDNQEQTPKESSITKLLNVDQPVLVQVVKEAIGSKGARLTSNISIAGRYLVLLPNTPHRGVSRRIEDPKARERLKKLIRAFSGNDNFKVVLACQTGQQVHRDRSQPQKRYFGMPYDLRQGLADYLGITFHDVMDRSQLLGHERLICAFIKRPIGERDGK